MRRTERLGVRRLTAAVGTALVLVSGGAGCATVPTSGSPRVAQEDHGKDTLSQPYVRLIATPPKKGAPPEDIVRGFQAAMAAFDDPGLTIAREYLTPGAVKRWNPWRQTRIYEGKIESDHTLDLQKAMRTTVTLKGTAVATIDPEGRSTPAAGTIGEPFTLVKQDGEWRIDVLSDGRLLSYDDLQRAYRRWTCTTRRPPVRSVSWPTGCGCRSSPAGECPRPWSAACSPGRPPPSGTR